MTPEEKEKIAELFIHWLKGEAVVLPEEIDDLLKDAEIDELILRHPVVVEAKRKEAECRANGLPCRMPF